MQNGTKLALHSTGQVRLYSALGMIDRGKGFVLAGRVLSENTDKYIGIPQVGSHFDSRDTHESFDPWITEMVCNGVTDCFLHDAGYFFLPSGCHRYVS
jgi:hypothetical protein